MLSTVRWRPVLHQPARSAPRLLPGGSGRPKLASPHIRHPRPAVLSLRSRSFWKPDRAGALPVVKAGVVQPHSVSEASDFEVVFSETFALKRTQAVEGKITARLDRTAENPDMWRLVVTCDIEGKWVLYWGVTYSDDFGNEWDQPPPGMRPPGSIPIKDYAIETPLKNSSSSLDGQVLYEVQIDIDSSSSIAAIHFVLKEEETGAWIQHKGRDIRIPLVECLEEGCNSPDGKQGFSIWPGAFNQFSNLLLKAEGPRSDDQGAGADAEDSIQKNRRLDNFYEEYSIVKEELVQNILTVSVRNSSETGEKLVQFDTDIPGNVVVHWGVCKDDNRKWEIPPAPHPPGTKIFRQKALRTLLQPKADALGNWGLFPVSKEFSGVLFVLKLNEYVWLNNMGTDFYIPLISASTLPTQTSRDQTLEKLEQSEPQNMGDGQEQSFISKNDSPEVTFPLEVGSPLPSDSKNDNEPDQAVHHAVYTDEIINEIRNLVTDISSGKGKRTKNKEAQENILQEIEKLAAEAYSIFRSSSPTFMEESLSDVESLKPSVQVCSGTGSGYEILCQGFNWESHKSGRWYIELGQKARELSSLGFTVIWLPPPTESVSPEGYMPKDLYNLNSRYGSMEELKDLVRSFHEVGIKVLGDVVLNHRCAHYQNSNGVWNIFGGRLNWDDRAVVADDPHFQGRGNKSSGDNFHAAPNIDHSQDFVRKDLKEWLCWLRREVGYDGWRLDFVRGFWGGYVKDYLEASEPYFVVGEYWDSLSYTYGEMDHNQDAHRQRIIDWINATNGTAGAFDVTTKGILHSTLERCEYWRLSDQKGKPPGMVGWWPSRAVTFIENHDTGSTQGHWRFPSGKEMQGYAYILTHPGTPAVFYDHIFSHYQPEISKLISLRQRTKLHCRSMVKIVKAERDVYAAEIDEKVAVKIGPGYYEPQSNTKRWVLAAEGKEYKVWEAS